MEPFDWNVVTLGAWNLPILTPAWVVQTMLRLPINTTMEVMVPIDSMGSHAQIRHGGLTIAPTPGQLAVGIGTCNHELLGTAMDAMKRGVEDLSRTPLRACGINLRYSAAQAPAELLNRTRCETEAILPRSAFDILSRRRGETLSHLNGKLNVLIDIPNDGPTSITLNFELLSSSNNEIKDWLSQPAANLVATGERLIELLAEPTDE